jgi:hypothetical protein
MAQVSIRREVQPSFNVTGNSGGGVGIQLQQTANKFVRPAAAARFAPPPSPLDEEVDGIEDALNEIANPGKVQEGSVASSYTDGDYDEDGKITTTRARRTRCSRPPRRKSRAPGS